jgi:hypothetical protein
MQITGKLQKKKKIEVQRRIIGYPVIPTNEPLLVESNLNPFSRRINQEETEATRIKAKT